MTASMLSRRGPPLPPPVLPWLSSYVHRDQHRDKSRTDTRTETAIGRKNEYDHGTEKGEEEEDDGDWASPPPAPPAKKRKLDRGEQGHGLLHHGLETLPTTNTKTKTMTTSSTIRIRPHGSTSAASDEEQDQTLDLEPLTVLPRARLPLSWLGFGLCVDTPNSQSTSTNGLQSHKVSSMSSTNLFVADSIPALDNYVCGDESWEPTVLAARSSSSNGGFYIIERVRKSIYSLSRLESYVEEGELLVVGKGWQKQKQQRQQEQRVRTGVSASSLRLDSSTSSVMLPWWYAARVHDPGTFESVGPSVKWMKGEVSLVFDQAAQPGVRHDASVEAQTSEESGIIGDACNAESTFIRISDDHSVPIPVEGDIHAADVMQSAQELLDNLRDQYLKTLYVSKTSVAYFAKGPLARCRAAFQQTESQASKTTSELVAFYRDAILNARKMDLKYKETLPAIIHDAALDVSGEEDTVTKKKKKRSRKGKRLGKNGLYPDEEPFVGKWWKGRSLSDQPALAETTSRDAEIKKHAADLRLRETQLQILLILETLALEAALSEEQKENRDTTHAAPLADDATKSSKGSKKKLQDLTVLLELHLDRMCIWHAVSFEESVVTDSLQTHDRTHLSGQKVESDAVRDFCTEVIVPFYAARLPDKCKYITRKFGVSSGVSPAAKKSSSTALSTHALPGSAVKRQPAASTPTSASAPRPRRSFQRVLTDEQSKSMTQKPHIPPSLTRSSTASSSRQATESGRDSMEPLLPGLLSTNGLLVRGGIQKAKRAATNREVDLNAVAKQHETKLKKVQMLSEQKKELDAAILALRKPNRQLVARDVAEAAEKRRLPPSTSGSGSGSSRKPKNPVRNPFAQQQQQQQGVQVMATPRGARKRDVAALAAYADGEEALPSISRKLVRSTTTPFIKDWDRDRNRDRNVATMMVNDSSPLAVRDDEIFTVPSSSALRPMSTGPPFVLDPDPETGSIIQETPSRRRPPPRPGSGSGSIFGDGKANITSMARRPTSSSLGIGSGSRGLFRVPSHPARQPELGMGTTSTSTPISVSASRTLFPVNDDQEGMMHPNVIAESPSPKGDRGRATITADGGRCSSPVIGAMTTLTAEGAVLVTPVKRSGSRSTTSTTAPAAAGSAAAAMTPMIPVTPEKSIYQTLGWEEEEEDEMVF